MSMEKYYTPTDWENYPSEDTAINAMRLNHAEDGINELDDRIVELSTDKSEVDWNQILLSGEKIAEITINGIKKDVYTSNDSAKAEAQAYKAEGYATGEQNGIPVESGSPYYHNNSKYFSEESASHAEESSGFADDAEEEALVSEGWAVGEQNGVPVPSTSPYYHNNAKWYSEQANPTRLASLTDVDFGILRDDEIIVYDATSQKWKNEVGVSADLKSNTTGQFKTRTGGILNSCVVNIEPKQSGSGTPSPSNVRPITGHSSVEVDVNNKNYLPLPTATTKNGITLVQNDDGSLTITGTASANTYFDFSSDFDSTRFSGYTLYLISEYTGWSNSTVRARVASQGYSTTYQNLGANSTIDDNGSGLALTLRVGNGFEIPTGGINIKPMLVKNAEENPIFVPYNGTDYTISLDQTVYGGNFDAVSGVGSDEWVNIASYNGETITEPWLSSMDEYVSGTTPTTGAQVVYKKATASSFSTTPQQINTLIGENHLDIPLEGQSLNSLSYKEMMAWDDVERAVAIKLDLSSVAPIEYTDKASQSYNQKQLFIKDGKLGQALTSISSGASFTENTNFKYTTLAEIIEPLIP